MTPTQNGQTGVAPESISVVIPHKCAAEGLWATVTSLNIALAGVPHEFIVVSGRDRDRAHDFLEKIPGLRIIESSARGPAESREDGAALAQYDWLLFLDDHVLVPHDFLQILASPGDLIHCPTATYPWRPPMYEYAPDVEPDDMDAPIRTEPSSDEPYPILAAGHGTFLIKRHIWEAIGGYGSIFDGWNGEEIYLGLKTWMHGFEVYMNPRVMVWHFVGKAAEWKNRDEAMKARLARSKRHLLNLRAKYSYQEAREIVKERCQQFQLSGTAN